MNEILSNFHSNEPMDYVRVALAIETLSYYRPGYLNEPLALDERNRSREVQALLIECMEVAWSRRHVDVDAIEEEI